MTAALTTTEKQTELLVLHYSPPLRRLSDDEFFDFCMANKELRIELSSEGDLIIMPPTGGKTGIRNSKLNGKLVTWAEVDGTGQTFDSSTVFSLPNGAKRSPDLSWLRNERWARLTEKEQERFPPLCPDFVAEIRSRTDSLKTLQRKMDEYIANGAQLGWLLDPLKKKVYIYRPDAAVEVLDNPQTVSGEPLLHGFTLDVQAIWK